MGYSDQYKKHHDPKKTKYIVYPYVYFKSKKTNEIKVRYGKFKIFSSSVQAEQCANKKNKKNGNIKFSNCPYNPYKKYYNTNII